MTDTKIQGPGNPLQGLVGPDGTFNEEAYFALLGNEEGDLEVINSQRFLSRVSPVKYGISTTVSEVSMFDPIALKLQDLYYRELFGRPFDSKKDEVLDQNKVLIAYQGERVVGAEWFCVEPTNDYSENLYLDQLYVMPELRGRGVGTKLLLSLLDHVPENHSVVTYAWDRAKDFYGKHGFVTTEDKTEKEEEHFTRMALPLTKIHFDGFCERKGHGYFEGFETVESVLKSPFDYEFFSKFVSAISNLKAEDEEDLSRNPFTAFIYQKSGLEHALFNEKKN